LLTFCFSSTRNFVSLPSSSSTLCGDRFDGDAAGLSAIAMLFGLCSRQSGDIIMNLCHVSVQVVSCPVQPAQSLIGEPAMILSKLGLSNW
jgi:hypothetical protein